MSSYKRDENDDDSAPFSWIPFARLPAAESPTVIPLADKSKVAIHTVCKEDVFWKTIESLKLKGASSILVLPIEKLTY